MYPVEKILVSFLTSLFLTSHLTPTGFSLDIQRKCRCFPLCPWVWPTTILSNLDATSSWASLLPLTVCSLSGCQKDPLKPQAEPISHRFKTWTSKLANDRSLSPYSGPWRSSVWLPINRVTPSITLSPPHSSEQASMFLGKLAHSCLRAFAPSPLPNGFPPR